MSALENPPALVPGRFYTMGRMKHACADRSYIGHVWEVLAVNETHAVIVSISARSYSSFGKEPLIVCIAEFDWAPADTLVTALADYGPILATRTGSAEQ